jgi:hypothetical protein
MPDALKIKTDYEIIIAAGIAELGEPTIPHTQWVGAAKEGQVIALQDGLGVITREGLESSVGTWKNGNIFDDHKTLKAGFTIHGDKFISPYLYFQLDDVIVAHLGKSAGGSIDALAMKVDGNRVTGMKGVGYSVISPGVVPSCTKEAGCGIPIAGKLKQNIKSELEEKGGDKGKMVDKTPEVKPEVTFSPTQVAEIKAAAIAEVTEQLGYAHKAGVADMEAAQAAELKTLTDAHTAELETQRELVTKQVGMVEALATQYSLSDDAKKALSDAKTLEDALVLFAGLKITKPIAGKGAAEGKEDDKAGKGGGVIEGAGKIEAKAPETVKVQEIGSWDAYTRKYVPTFREEMK